MPVTFQSGNSNRMYRDLLIGTFIEQCCKEEINTVIGVIWLLGNQKKKKKKLFDAGLTDSLPVCMC